MTDTELKAVETDATKALAETKATIASLEADAKKDEAWSKSHVAVVWGVVGLLVGGVGLALVEHLLKP